MYDHRITGKVIRKLRLRKGLTQEVLSGLAGISRSHLAMIESGSMSASVETLWKIAKALGIKLSVLLEFVEQEINR